MKSFTQKIKNYIQNLFPTKKILFSDSQTITLNQIFEGPVTKGTEHSINSAYARPYRVLIEENRNVGRVNYLLYHNKDSNKSHLLGSLCYTSYSKKMKRLLFFPGIIGRKFLWHSKKLTDIKNVELDHITIQPDFKTWHYTAYINNNKKNKFNFPNNNLIEIEPELYSWFGLSIKNSNILELLWSNYNLTFGTHVGEMDDLHEKILEIKEGAIEHTFQQVTNEPNSEEFIHFDFLIDKRKFFNTDSYLQVGTAPTTKPALISDVIDPPFKFPIMQYEVSVKDFPGKVIVLVSKHKGVLSQNVIFTAR